MPVPKLTEALILLVSERILMFPALVVYLTAARVQHTVLDMSKINITVSGVDKLMKNFQAHKAAGPDELPAHIL